VKVGIEIQNESVEVFCATAVPAAAAFRHISLASLSPRFARKSGQL
jgi:hypothetical protein